MGVDKMRLVFVIAHIFLTSIHYIITNDTIQPTQLPKMPVQYGYQLSHYQIIEIFKQLSDNRASISRLDALLTDMDEKIKQQKLNLAKKDKRIRRLENKLLVQQFRHTNRPDNGLQNRTSFRATGVTASLKRVETKVNTALTLLKKFDNDISKNPITKPMPVNSKIVTAQDSAVRIFVRRTLEASNDLLKFNDVKINEGGGYDPFTGYFTAPVKGAYFFTVNIIKHREKECWFNLNFRENGATKYSVLASAYSSQGQNPSYQNMATSAIVHLKEGDQVFVRFYGKTTTWDFTDDNVKRVYKWNTMSGFLL